MTDVLLCQRRVYIFPNPIHSKMSAQSDSAEESFSMAEFLKKDMDENPEIYEAFSTDLDDTNVRREDYGY